MKCAKFGLIFYLFLLKNEGIASQVSSSSSCAGGCCVGVGLIGFCGVLMSSFFVPIVL
jgi:hypothetical protein